MVLSECQCKADGVNFLSISWAAISKPQFTIVCTILIFLLRRKFCAYMVMVLGYWQIFARGHQTSVCLWPNPVWIWASPAERYTLFICTAPWKNSCFWIFQFLILNPGSEIACWLLVKADINVLTCKENCWNQNILHSCLSLVVFWLESSLRNKTWTAKAMEEIGLLCFFFCLFLFHGEL